MRNSHDFDIARYNMVEEQLKPRGVKSLAVLEAMLNVPRHLFVPEELQNCAYLDSPLPIGYEQTISQPYIVAYMTEQLEAAPGMRILEIGTGSGYQTAILTHLGCTVFSIEFMEEIAGKARQTLAALGYDHVKVKHGNGYHGWPAEAPFDAIIVTAAPESIPETLIGQLKTDGKMIVPVGRNYSTQWLKLIVKTDDGFIEKELIPVRFVPMVEVLPHEA